MNIALKEWSAVIVALDRSTQIFRLRKGGIVEARRGFEPRYAEFLFFLATEHQHARYLKPKWAGLLSHTPAQESLYISRIRGGPRRSKESVLGEAEFAQRRQGLLDQLGIALDTGKGVEQAAE